MKEQLTTQVMIHASVDAVWTVLTDFSKYPEWSSFIQSFDGIPQVGKRSKVLLSPPEGNAISMNPIFLKIQENKELRWKGKLGINGIFDGEHYFLLQAISPTETLLIQGENFSGILVPFLKKMIHGSTRSGFELFNQALKKRVEAVYKY